MLVGGFPGNYVASCSTFGSLGSLLGDSWESLGALLTPLRTSWSLLGASWEPLGGLLEGLEGFEEALSGFLEALGRIFGRLGARLGRLGGALGASWEALGSNLAPQELPNTPQIGQNPTPKRMAC